MTIRDPNLLELLHWSEQAARGEPCAEWLAWRKSSPLAARRAVALVDAVNQLDGGNGPMAATELGATDVAEYIERRLSPAASEQFEAACWNSPEQLGEVASAVRFSHDSGVYTKVSNDLTERLLAIAPRAIERRKRRMMNGFSAQVTSATPVASAVQSAAQPAAPAVALIERPKAATRKLARGSYLPIAAAAAALLLVTLGGAIGWWLSLAVKSHDPRPPVARDPQPAPARDEDDNGDRPLVNRLVLPAPDAPPPDPSSPDLAPSPQSVPQLTQSDSPSAPIRQHTVPAPAAATPPPVVTIESAIGAVLVDAGRRGRLRVGHGTYSLAEPLRLVSLAESWSSVEIPDVGRLVLAGSTEATLASWGDGVLEIELAYGKLGIERLPASRHIRFHAGSAQWLARGTSNYSTLAVLHDPESPSLFVPSGSVAVDNVQVAARQVVRFVAGTPQPPQPTIASRPTDTDALAEGWLTPPDDERKKKWQAQHGKLIDRLAIVDDVGDELPLLFASTRDTRQAALLAEWNFAAADDAVRPAQLWTLLGDHRELVRTAGVRTLFAIRAGDPRLAHFVRFVRMELGEDAGTRMAQWMRGKEQPGQIAAPQAAELAEFLLHRDLAMRQLTVSLLERHATPALARARRGPPAYDAADPVGKRTEAQRQWRQLIRQIFAAQRTAPAALAPQLAPNAANVKQP